jgi:2-dehydropantoate 2-reductase
MNQSLHWYILGAGAIGSLIAYRLKDVHPCTLLHQHPTPGKRRIIEGDQRAELKIETLDTVPPQSIKHLLLTTKAGQLAAALESVQGLLASEAVIVTTANGLGFEPALKSLCPRLPLYRALSTAAAYRNTEGDVIVAAIGRTRVGCIDAEIASPDWFENSLGRLEGWQWEKSIDAAIGEKFSLNCVINPLTAVLGCRNGELLEDGAAGSELAALCTESEPVLRRLGLWRRTQSLLESAVDICTSTAANHSSMLQDVLAERPTEINFLNGELLRRAGGLGVDLPESRALIARVQAATGRTNGVKNPGVR